MNKIENINSSRSSEERDSLEHWLLLQQLGIEDVEKIAPREKTDKIPLSFSQWRLWFLDQYGPGNPVFNIPVAYRLTGSINEVVLHHSLNEIVRRHEALRTVFRKIDGEPFQIIKKSIDIPFEITDLRSVSEITREAEIINNVISEIRKSFDLSLGPLIRARLIRIKDDDNILTITIHHIVSDGWSMGIFFRELNSLYKAYLKKEPSPLPDCEIQYADYAIWQRNWLKGENLQKQLSYWKKQLQDYPTLELPTDFPRPPVQTFHGESQKLALTNDLTDKVKQLSKKENVTNFMTLLTAFSIILYRYSGQADLLIGTPIAGRNRIEIENTFGFFLNSLIIRIDTSSNPTFTELLHRVREIVIEAFDHQDLPFEKIIEELNPPRDLSRTPFYQIFFNMINVETGTPKLHNLEVYPYRIGSHLVKFDLTVYISEKADKFTFSFAYNSKLFSETRISSMISHYKGLLQQVTEDPGKKIKSYVLKQPENIKVIPDPTEILKEDWMGSIHDKVSQHALHTPENIAVIDKNGSWTYLDLDVFSDQIASQLISEGIKSSEIVAIYAHRSTEFVAAILGIHKAGAAFLILDPAYPSLRIVGYLRVAKPAGFIHIDAGRSLPLEISYELDRQEVKVRYTTSILSHSQKESTLDIPPENPIAVEVGPDDLAYIAFTSGSTGKPKGIMGRHGSLSHFIPWQQSIFGLSTKDRFSMLSGLSHDPLQREIFTPLWIGATVCIPDPDRFGDAGYLLKWMSREKITFAHLTPALGQFITYSSGQTVSLDNLRHFFFVGDRLTQNEVRNLRRLAPQATFVNSYGSTETQRAVSYFLIPPVMEIDHQKMPHEYPLGVGIPDVQLLILNDDCKLCGIGELGEIHFRSPHLALGYLGDPSQTERSFIPNPYSKNKGERLYKTGDLGRYLPDGNVMFAGRKDTQVKIRGFRIELKEISLSLMEHPAIKDALVTTKGEDGDELKLIAYIIPTSEKIPSQQALKNFLLKSLPDYMVPSIFVKVDFFPLTPNGKINFNELPPPDLTTLNLSTNYLAPKSLEENIITMIWSDVLKKERIGIHDNFYDLGGHSLLAIQIISKMEKALAKSVPLALFMGYPTIEGLADAISSQESLSEDSSLVVINPDGSKPPIFCVPPAASTAMRFKVLQKYLGDDQPLFSFEYPGMDGKTNPITSIPAMAENFNKEVLATQPCGPYYLVGLCYGGNVAFEMAQQLTQEGHKVAFLGILDSNFAPQKRRTTAYYLYKFRQFINTVILGQDRPVGELMLSRGRWQNIDNDPIKQHIYKVFTANIQARLSYTSPPYPGKITKFSTTWGVAEYATKQWRKMTTVGLEDHKVPGAHSRRNPDDTGMMDEPNVQVLVDKLKECLEIAHLENQYRY